jgi:hypothetical protein
MNVSPGMKVIVSVENQSVLVLVTSANLATLFGGQPYDPDTETWLPTQLYTYEQVLAVVEKRQPPIKPA